MLMGSMGGVFHCISVVRYAEREMFYSRFSGFQKWLRISHLDVPQSRLRHRQVLPRRSLVPFVVSYHFFCNARAAWDIGPNWGFARCDVCVKVVTYLSTAVFITCFLADCAFPDFKFCVISHCSVGKRYCVCRKSNILVNLRLMTRFASCGRKNPLLLMISFYHSFTRWLIRFPSGRFSVRRFIRLGILQ